MKIKQTRSTKIALEIANELEITDLKTILELKAEIAGQLLMNPELTDDEVAFNSCISH